MDRHVEEWEPGVMDLVLELGSILARVVEKYAILKSRASKAKEITMLGWSC